MNMERRKAPRVGDLVRIPVEMDTEGIVERCEGIHLYVRLFARRDGARHPSAAASSGLSYVRRDSVEVISRANSG